MLRESRLLRLVLAMLVAGSLCIVTGCEISSDNSEETTTESGTEAEGHGEAAEGEAAEESMTSEEALLLLEEGNERFLNDEPAEKEIDSARRMELLDGQKPFAVIVTCSDSRVPPEIVFDQALGELFVIRVAGNVIDPVALGSIEYAVEHLGSPLVVVLGHQKCGAVTAAVEGEAAAGSIGSIVELIAPAVEAAEALGVEEEEELLDEAIILNVENSMAAIETSPLIEEAIASGKLEILGAKYFLSTGKVEWLEE